MTNLPFFIGPVLSNSIPILISGEFVTNMQKQGCLLGAKASIVYIPVIQ